LELPLNLPDTLFIAVNYNTQDHAIRFVESLMRQEITSWECLIVNNGGPTDKLDATAGTGTQIITPPSNLGYFGGARFGLSLWLKERGCVPLWTVVSNVDIVCGPSFLSELTKVQADVVAPAVISSTGRDQNPYMTNRPGAIRTMTRLVALGTPGLDGLSQRIAFKRSLRPDQTPRVPQLIYAPYGAVVAFNRTYFGKGGSLAHDPYLFGEEISIGEQSRSIAASVQYEPAVKTYHAEHVSTGRGSRSVEIRRKQREAVWYAARILLPAHAGYRRDAAGPPARELAASRQPMEAS
jgi:hypothetical protein